MNLKLTAFIFASGVMQSHGVTQCNPDYMCTSDPNCAGFFGCINALDVDQTTEDMCADWCEASDDWKWNPNNPRPPQRKLDESDILASLSSSCADTFYKISIKTIGEYGHIGALAEPSCKDADNIKACVDCPSYVFHANLDAEHPDLLQKIVEEVVVVDDKENVKPDIEIEHLYELQELFGAFKDVELDDNESYNLMYNNCGTFLIKMAHKLGIDPTDPDIINSVATMLSPTTKVGAVIGGSKYMARFIGNYVHAN